MKSYAEKTYNSKNPIVRFAHRKRFKISLSGLDLKDNYSILDYGCGDGQFLLSLQKINPNTKLTLVGFEPYQTLKKHSGIEIFDNKETLTLNYNKNKFDIITCFEVLEHFNKTNQQNLLNQISSLLKETGLLVISVPIETGLPSLIKNIIRKYNYPDQEVYKVKNIIRALFYRPLEKYRSSDSYLSHAGFNHKILEKLLKKDFNIVKKRYSPFQIFRGLLNSQIFYFLTCK